MGVFKYTQLKVAHVKQKKKKTTTNEQTQALVKSHPINQ